MKKNFILSLNLLYWLKIILSRALLLIFFYFTLSLSRNLDFIISLFTFLPFYPPNKERLMRASITLNNVHAVVNLLIIISPFLLFLLVLFFLPARLITIVNRLLSRISQVKMIHFLSFLIISFLILTNLFSYFCFEHIPHVQDSIAQCFQAKIFKIGRLYADLPNHKEFFDYVHVINQERWYSIYSPGHPFLLMLGLFIGMPWIVNPVLGALALLVIYYLGKELYDEETSRLAAFLLFASPFVLFMSSEFMNHSSTMLALILFALFLVKTIKGQRNLHALLAGLSLGFACNIRPLDALAIGTPLSIFLICTLFKKRITVTNFIVFSLGVSSLVILLLMYNSFTTGKPLLFGHSVYFGNSGLGFGKSYWGSPHTPALGLWNMIKNLNGLNKYLFEWPIPSLTSVFIFFFIPFKRNKWDYLLISVSLSLFIAYYFFFYQDLCFGPRYYYSATPFLVLLTARGIFFLPQIQYLKPFSERIKAALTILLSLCLLYMTYISLPPLFRQYSNCYWGVSDLLYKQVKERGIRNALIFIDCNQPPNPNFLSPGLLHNSPSLDDKVIFAIDLGKRNIELMGDFPGRDYYLCRFNEQKGKYIFSNASIWNLTNIKVKEFQKETCTIMCHIKK